MPTIKTYSKGAPFYNASAYRKVAFTHRPVTDDASKTGNVGNVRLANSGEGGCSGTTKRKPDQWSALMTRILLLASILRLWLFLTLYCLQL